jgi:hypothetical protein
MPGSERVVAVSHGVILLIVVAMGLVDLAMASLFGAFLSGTLSLPLVVFLIGFARHRRGRGDGRTIMAIADIGILLILGPFLLPVYQTSVAGMWAPAAALLSALTFAGLISIAVMRPPIGSLPVERSRVHDVGALAFVVLGLGSIVPSMLSTGGPIRLDLMLFGMVPAIVTLALKAVAWWWGVGWLMAMTGVGSLALAANLAILFGLPSAAAPLVMGALSLVLAARPPRIPGERALGGLSRSDRPSAASVAWALTGAVLLAPSLLIGPLAPRLVDCFDCPSPSPLAIPSIFFDLVLLLMLPAVAVALAWAERSSRTWSGAAAWIGFVASALVVGQGLAAILDVPGFEFFLPVAPAAAIATVGFGLAIARPTFLFGIGSWSAVGCALAGMVWMTGAAAGGVLASLDFSIVQITTLGTGVLVTLALGREFAIRLEGSRESLAADLST